MFPFLKVKIILLIYSNIAHKSGRVRMIGMPYDICWNPVSSKVNKCTWFRFDTLGLWAEGNGSKQMHII